MAHRVDTVPGASEIIPDAAKHAANVRGELVPLSRNELRLLDEFLRDAIVGLSAEAMQQTGLWLAGQFALPESLLQCGIS